MSGSKLSAQSWSSQTVFILAAVGSAVGLGNIWKFPYITGEYGGGAFVLVYLLCVFLIGLPIMLSEIALGRAGKANPVRTMAKLAKESNSSKAWALVGFNSVMAGLLILSFYSVIAGLVIAYFFYSLFGSFSGISGEVAKQMFADSVANPWALLFWFSLALGLTLLIVARGIKNGLEKAVNFMMPALFIVLMILLVYAIFSGSFGESFAFIFAPDFSKLTWTGVLIALGQAFFTLSVGLGAMMAYGAYLDDKASIVKAGLWIVGLDTLVALLAGLVIFAIVFQQGLSPAEGPGLLFTTLPIAFGQMPGGWLFGSLFFALVIMAAISSTISLVEPSVAWMDQRFSIARSKSIWILGAIAWLLGVGALLSFNYWQDLKLLGSRNFFDSLDFLTTSIMLPVGGLFISIFMAWIIKPEIRGEQLGSSEFWMSVFLVTLRYITPFGIIVVFAYNLDERIASWLMAAVAIGYLGFVIQKKVSEQS